MKASNEEQNIYINLSKQKKSARETKLIIMNKKNTINANKYRNQRTEKKSTEDKMKAKWKFQTRYTNSIREKKTTYEPKKEEQINSNSMWPKRAFRC